MDEYAQMNNRDLGPDGLPPLNLPPAPLRIRREGDLIKVFDRLRRKYVNLTPEEYVRQHFVEFLTGTLHYPDSMMANEVSIDLNGTRKRCDTVVFAISGEPLMIVEYKAPGVAISQDVFDQIVRYNMRLRARYLVVSNGMRHYCCINDYEADRYQFIPRIPDYGDLTRPFSDN